MIQIEGNPLLIFSALNSDLDEFWISTYEA